MAQTIGKEISDATYVANGVGFVPLSAAEFVHMSGFSFMPVAQVSHPTISALNKRVGALQYEYRDPAHGLYGSLHYWRMARTQPRMNIYLGAVALDQVTVQGFFQDICERTGLSVMQIGVDPYSLQYMTIMTRILREEFSRQ